MKFFIIFERYFINGIMGNCLNDMIFFIVLEFGIGMLWNICFLYVCVCVFDVRYVW